MITRSETIDKTATALSTAARRFLEISDDRLSEMPERWVQCALAEALYEQAHLLVKIEFPITSLNLRNADNIREGKVDLVAYASPHDDSPRYVIEVKCARSTWPSVTEDASRIRQILEQNPSIELGMLTYVSGEMDEKDVDIDRRRMREASGGPNEARFEVHQSDGAQNLHWYCQVLTFEGVTTDQPR